MSDATVVALAKSIEALIQDAIDDPAEPLGASLTFNLKRVPFIKKWLVQHDESTIRIRVATHGTEGAVEESRTNYGVKYVIPVAIIRKLSAEDVQGESIDDDQTDVLAISDTLTSVVENLTQILAKRNNWSPAMDGLSFKSWTHQDAANKLGLIFNPEALSERRQYESVILLHYEAQFSAV